MSAQASFYNAIFFSYALVLTRFYGVAGGVQVGWYILPFAPGNFLGPLTLGPLFDIVGRKPMIGAHLRAFGIAARRDGLPVRPRPSLARRL